MSDYTWTLGGNVIVLKRHFGLAQVYNEETLKACIKNIKTNREFNGYVSDEVYEAHLKMMEEGLELLQKHLGKENK
jgi:hypothetical protein